MAQIAGKKFGHVRRSTMLLLAALPPWTVAIFWLFSVSRS